MSRDEARPAPRYALTVSLSDGFRGRRDLRLRHKACQWYS